MEELNHVVPLKALSRAQLAFLVCVLVAAVLPTLYLLWHISQNSAAP